MTDPTADAGSEPETEETPEPFENRAARRAKGKSAGNHVHGEAGQRQVRSGTVQSPRQYGNRRSG
ncbi:MULTISPECIES: hypothetical protein [Actinoplanes]|uniref:Uncharacterized protein n=2 Tax=Actinoplanes TaxID=1865 RepID=A0A0X3UPM0_9ACTN|nr:MULTISPECIES: hypothetical protein [Actinoplanes]KUL34529.1 hypothetical protein ADL15_15760 [Actinoplanes awajinensis subsp. mycoplanecinus]GIE72328.1 hypothetical protein Apa02nite_084360 [Actinoplanes palleronii]